MASKRRSGNKGFVFVLIVTVTFAGFLPRAARGDDAEIFKAQATPNVLLILDDSGSMARNYGGSEVGDLDGADRATFGGSGAQVSSRVDVTYRVLYQLLNADQSTVTISGNVFSYPTQRSHVLPDTSGTDGYLFNQNITATGDENALRFRLGLMLYGPDTTWNGFSRIQVPVQTAGTESNQPPYTNSYRSLWGAIKTSFTPGGNPTPMARSLDAAKTYFATAAAGDLAVACRKKFIVLVTDGEDTIALGGTGGLPKYYPDGNYGDINFFNANGIPGYGNEGQIARNSESIRQAKLLADNGISLFVVGVGMLVDNSGSDQPHLKVLRQVLRRMAEQKGIDLTAAEYDQAAQSGDNTALAAGNAFFSNNADDLLTALQYSFDSIIVQSRSFTYPVVPAVRTTDSNKLYLATFIPANAPETFWEGHLGCIGLQDNGALTSPLVVFWDGGETLYGVNRNYGSEPRNVYTASYSSGTWSRQAFSSSNSWLDNNVLGVPSSGRDDLINNVVLRTNQARRLGDIFHSNPVLVRSPNPFFFDTGFSTAECLSGSCQSFLKTQEHRQRVIYTGGNDGMLHAFDAGIWRTSLTPPSYDGGTGEELFAYIPRMLLGKLNHMRVTTTSSHPYLVDGSPAVADVWLDANGDNVKQSSEWKTVLVSGLRKGGRGLFALDVTHPPDRATPNSSQVTANDYSRLLWELTGSDITTLGESWSTPAIGKVKITDGGVVKNRWVVFVGGGYWTPPTLTANVIAGATSISVTSTEGFPASGTLQIGTDLAEYGAITPTSFTGIPSTGNIDRKLSAHNAGEALVSPLGKAFYVIDIGLGKVIWTLDAASDSGMSYPFVSPPVPIDTNGDNYVDYVYQVDHGGQLWRFDVKATGDYSSSSKTVTSGWSGKRIFAPSTLPPAQPFFNKPEVAFDGALNRWIYYGAGDQENPQGSGTGKFYAIRDGDPGSPYNDGNLSDFSSVLSNTDQTVFGTVAGGRNGWFAGMPNTGEKVLTGPVVFNGQLYFTTFQPTDDPCGGGGIARLYGLSLNLQAPAGTTATAGAGILAVTGVTGKQRSAQLAGGGIPSSPVLSMNASGGASLYIGTTNAGMTVIPVDTPASFKKLKKWKEWIAQ